MAGFATLMAGPALAQPGFATGDISGWRDTLDMLCAARGTAFVVLGSHLVDGSDFQIEYIVHRHDNVLLERIRIFEAVVGIQEHRIFHQGRHIAAAIRHRHHNSSILDEHADLTMIRVVVPRAMPDDDVRAPLANKADDLLPALHRRDEFPVMDVQHLRLRTDDRIRFFTSASRRCASGPPADCQ